MQQRTYVIACAVLARDLKAVADTLDMNPGYTFLEAGLHNNPEKLTSQLQQAIDTIAQKPDAARIVIGYGVCGKGTIGIRSPHIPLVIPKTHDCIALFLGGDERYREEFSKFPGTYYLSAGWCEENAEPVSQRSKQVWFGSKKIVFDELAHSHGEKTARTTFDFFNSWQKNYQRAVFIETGAKSTPRYEKQAQNMARAYGWDYAKIKGSHALLEKMMTATATNDSILVVPPEHVTVFDALTSALSASPVVEAQEAQTLSHMPRTITVEGEQKKNIPYARVGLGIDAGGTYTDAVLYDLQDNRTLCKAKALTTKWDFTIGISNALKQLDAKLLEKTELTALSTTLATNAIVENEGQKVGMLLMSSLSQKEKIAYEPKAIITGQMTINGEEQTAPDKEQIRAVARTMMTKHGVTAFAVSGYGGSVNPAHELVVKEILVEETGCFVCCGHELSSTLNFRTRAVTAMLNARIIPRLDSLLLALEGVLETFSIAAPVVVVKGDGTLMGADMAKRRPVETILSGPAASVAGARHLTRCGDALVVDIGGTTTDTAQLAENQVRLNEQGSHVGGHRTHVKALDIRTAGLGGDSLISFDKTGFHIGPKRVVPVCCLGSQYPDTSRAIEYLEHTLNKYNSSTQRMQLLFFTGSTKNISLTPQEEEIVTLLKQRPWSVDELAVRTGVLFEQHLPLERLEEHFLIGRCGLTPTDLLHIQGIFLRWDTSFSKQYARLLAILSGTDPTVLVETLQRQTVQQLALELIKCQLADEVDVENIDQCPVCATLLDSLMNRTNSQYQIRFALKRPVIGIGAPTACFLPEAAKILEAEAILPEDADVANAVGAITSHVLVKKQLRIIPAESGFFIEGLPGNRKSKDFEQADATARAELVRMVREEAMLSGTSCSTVTLEIEDQLPQTAYGDAFFIGRVIRASLSGRPDLVIEKTGTAG